MRTTTIMRIIRICIYATIFNVLYMSSMIEILPTAAIINFVIACMGLVVLFMQDADYIRRSRYKRKKIRRARNEKLGSR